MIKFGFGGKHRIQRKMNELLGDGKKLRRTDVDK